MMVYKKGRLAACEKTFYVPKVSVWRLLLLIKKWFPPASTAAIKRRRPHFDIGRHRSLGNQLNA
jgi:hypothetical protein